MVLSERSKEQNIAETGVNDFSEINHGSTVKLTLPFDWELFRELLTLFHRIYIHPDCPEVLRTYIYAECRRYFADNLDIKAFLEKGE